MVPKREYPALESPLTDARLEKPGEPHAEMEQNDFCTLTVRGFLKRGEISHFKQISG